MEKHKYDLSLITRLCKKYSNKGDNWRVSDLAQEYIKIKGIGDRNAETVRKRINNLIIGRGLKYTTEVKSSKAYEMAQKKSIKKTSVYFVTYAQANTPIDKNLWQNMLSYAKTHSAEIVVIPGTYLNAHSEFANYEHGWHPGLLPYMHAKEDKLHNYLTIISDANVLPTAERPLRGFEGVTGEESSIIGHPRHHIEVVPTLPQSRDKFLMTTGAITVPNYRNARVGKKAKFHHVQGFLIVEVFDEEHFVFRHISATKDGSFQDLCYKVSKGKVSKKGKSDTIVLGDLHLKYRDEDMLKETRRLAKKLNVDNLVTHDIFDGYSINHHEARDLVSQAIKEKKGDNSLSLEIADMLAWIDSWTKNEDWRLVIVPSNHNDWLDKWVRLQQGHKDIKNFELFIELQRILFNEEAPRGLVAYLIDKHFPINKVLTLGRHESFKRLGFELNNHGDLGSNGAKGTPNTFKKLNVKIVSGDKHFLYSLDGAHGVGISTHKDMGYNRGLSSWTKSHGVIHENGKYQHLIYVDGKFTNFI